MPASPKNQKKTYLGLTLPQLSIASVVVMLMCCAIVAVAGLAFSAATRQPTLIPTLPAAAALPPTATPVPTQTPFPSDTPTAPPTDIPSPTFTPTEPATATITPSPTIQPTRGVPKPPDTTDNIHVAQIFTSPTNPEDEVGRVDLVWGSAYPNQPAGVFNLYYYPFDRDADTGTGGTHHDLNWFMANHADWIEYTCDKKTPAYEYGDPEVPLDITNPAVIDYMLQTYIFPAIQQGYQGIAFDNVDFGNNGNRCGIWKNGQWIKQSDYIGGVLKWAAYMYKALHILNTSVAMNFPFDFNHQTESFQMYQYLDIALDERGFTNRGQPSSGYLGLSQWVVDMQAIQYLAAHGKGFVSINEMPERFAQVSQAEKQWALANYLLVKGQYSYIAITGIQEYGKTLWTPEYSAAIGHALGFMYQSQGVYLRDFSNGIAIVNPSSFGQTFTVSLPPGVYQDLYGNKIDQVTLPPQTAIVLLGKTPHTSDLFSGPNNAFFSFSPKPISSFP